MNLLKIYDEFIKEEYKSGKRNANSKEKSMCKHPKGFSQINHCKALGLKKEQMVKKVKVRNTEVKNKFYD